MSFKNNLIAIASAFAVALLACAPPSTASAQSTGRARRGARTTTRPQTPPTAPDVQPTPTPAPQGGNSTGQAVSSVTIRWQGQPGVERYRLQVARDRGFEDIIFDQAVTGRYHNVTVAPGNYFWRVAPAVVETGRYSTPLPVEVVAGPSVRDDRGVTVAKGASGWRTATGQIPRPVPARLRAGGGFDLVGVNTDGMVYAIDGANGIAMWTARYKPGARRDEVVEPKGTLFSPLIVEGSGGRTDVVVAFAEGLRALKGETGAEVWRAQFAGRAAAGTVADVNGDGKKEIVAIATDPPSLIVLDTETGRALSNSKLESDALGAPAVLIREGKPLIVVGLQGGVIEAWSASGERVNSEKLESNVTTGPLVVSTPRALIVVVGGEKGLLALGSADLKPIGMINTGEDSPRGTLTTADIDGDGTIEIVMVTRGGRVALIGTTDGKIRWVAEGAGDADSAALADLNGDGTLDVIAAAGPVFAYGFSGRDGALIWKVEEEIARGGGQPVEALPRSLTVAASATGEAFLVGGDPLRRGLRAVELPKGSVKADLR
jgi:outer membrane protein assembly factor BamB